MLGMLADPQCDYCRHLDRKRMYKQGYYCPAYPNGVPDEILLNMVDHVEAYEGDNGIQFEQDPSEDEFFFDTPRSVTVH
ncbi:MAG: hypothetical protein ACXV5F_09355 [Halobacteriota archaeon]